MSRHPVDGIAGSKPRVPGVKSAAKANGEVSKAELSALNREYLAARNRAQQAKAESAEILLAEKKGTLISRKLAGFQLGYLLTAFRQRTLAAPVNIAGRLAALGLVDAAKEHSTAEAIKEDVYALLEDLADLPDQVTDPDWLQKIDGDLLEQVEGTPERGQTPVQAKGAAEQAKIRREKKNAAQRRRRAEGRVKG